MLTRVFRRSSTIVRHLSTAFKPARSGFLPPLTSEIPLWAAAKRRGGGGGGGASSGGRGGRGGNPSNNDDGNDDGEYVSIDSAAEHEQGKEDGDKNAVVPHTFTVPNEVFVIPMYRRPIFPGIVIPIVIQNQEYLDQILHLRDRGEKFVGVFMVKPELDSGQQSTTDGSVPNVDSMDQLYSKGVLARILRIIPIRNGSAQVLLAGHCRITADGQAQASTDAGLPHKKLIARIRQVKDETYDRNDVSVQAYTQEIYSTIKEILKMNPFFKEQLQALMEQIDISNPAELADLGAALTTSDPRLLQECIETSSVPERLSKTLLLLRSELDISRFQQKVSRDIEEKVTKSQRKQFLMQQLTAIKKELGLEKDEKEALLKKFRQRIEALVLPEHAKKVIDEEMVKLETIESSSSEFNLSRNYLDWLTLLPWGKFSEDKLDIRHAEVVLDQDHYGLDDVKERIKEFIGVGILRGTVQGKILCLVGPPGVGKTSIGKSIAHSLDRKFFRFSVGGMSDVAEIKGHRRTYVGAMPGKLLQAMKNVQTSNPVIMIDEIDKLGKGYQGDPASALLEVLDPEQNGSFLDHYLDVSFDLSRVLFVCTANSLDTIPKPLLDRMEVIRLSGYVLEEKLAIAQRYLVPQSVKDNGLEGKNVKITDAAMTELIRFYCREAGVRNLQKQVEKIFRKAAYKIVKQEVPETGLEITADTLKEYVGKPVFSSDRYYDEPPVGVAMGLAWTELGGQTLYIECTSVPELKSEAGTLRCTGQMGDVMKESSTIAYTYAKRFLRDADPQNEFLQRTSIHMHIPEGATPKDGPSAGITMTCAILSLAMNKPLRNNVSMTGELTLTGKVLPIGGVKEKTIAAKRSMITEIVFPKANQKDWDELPSYIKDGVTPHFVDTFQDVYKVAFP
ncbi:mitochondrial Lon protease [Andalucia godoyi]|uniref:Lon protease homolog n=1 Tax=Andalucia godoyi TaxID=505711 RepID=A0A8K0AGS6_ANDGO|nr:mitochondrial Lon protease [Andalucia godoyi]|eukprot:ANDGO_08253.mRNA.1 mitochondrial Lon protease